MTVQPVASDTPDASKPSGRLPILTVAPHGTFGWEPDSGSNPSMGSPSAVAVAPASSDTSCAARSPKRQTAAVRPVHPSVSVYSTYVSVRAVSAAANPSGRLSNVTDCPALMDGCASPPHGSNPSSGSPSTQAVASPRSEMEESRYANE